MNLFFRKISDLINIFFNINNVNQKQFFGVFVSIFLSNVKKIQVPSMIKTKTFPINVYFFCRKRNSLLMSIFRKNPLRKADQALKTNQSLRFLLHDVRSLSIYDKQSSLL